MTNATAQRYGDDQPKRGRDASRPSEIPGKGWWDILRRCWREIAEDNISLVSAGVAFYALLAIFPALAALISIYGLVADPGQVQQQLHIIDPFLPAEAVGILDEQMRAIASQHQSALGFGAALGLLLTIWSATKGTKSMMTALNIVYGEQEERSFLVLNLTAISLTVGALLILLISLGAIVVLPTILGFIGMEQITEDMLALSRWPLLIIIVSLAIAVLYRYGPSRRNPRWRWVSWGATTATLLWIIGSALFSYYVSNFGSYNETYGSVGAIVILLMWFYVSAFVVLLGAELNAEMEHQTRKDSTVNGNQPMGSRGAYVADTLGEVKQ
jgi:membrane protein